MEELFDVKEIEVSRKGLPPVPGVPPQPTKIKTTNKTTGKKQDTVVFIEDADADAVVTQFIADCAKRQTNHMFVFIGFRSYETKETKEFGVSGSDVLERNFKDDSDSYGGRYGDVGQLFISEDMFTHKKTEPTIENKAEFVEEVLDCKRYECVKKHTPRCAEWNLTDVHWSDMRLFITEKAVAFLKQIDINVDKLITDWAAVVGQNATQSDIDLVNQYDVLEASGKVIEVDIKEIKPVLLKKCGVADAPVNMEYADTKKKSKKSAPEPVSKYADIPIEELVKLLAAKGNEFKELKQNLEVLRGQIRNML